jgi:hypothetical protein
VPQEKATELLVVNNQRPEASDNNRAAHDRQWARGWLEMLQGGA